MSLFHGIDVVSIAIPDLERARAFYADVLGLGAPVYDLPEAGWIEFGTGGAGGNLAVTAAEPGWQPSTGTTIVLNTADCTPPAPSCAPAACAATSPWCSPASTWCKLLRPVRQSPADGRPGAGE